jgi:hypothetical protein
VFGGFFMVEPVSLADLGTFLKNLMVGYDDYLFFGFVLMAFFNIAMFTKNILSGSR